MNTYEITFKDPTREKLTIEAEYISFGTTYVRFCRERSGYRATADGDDPTPPVVRSQILGLVPHSEVLAVVMTTRETS